MKKIIITPILIILLASCGTFKHSSKVNPNYKQLSTFKSNTITIIGADTAEYLKYNFIENKDRYIGKKLESVLNDVNIKIESISPIIAQDHGGFFNKLIIEFRKSGFEYRFIYDLIIYFDERISISEFEKIDKPMFVWNKEKHNFFKNRIVKDIVMTDSRNWSQAGRDFYFK